MTLQRKARDPRGPAVPSDAAPSDSSYADVSIDSDFGEAVNKGPYPKGAPPAVPTETVHLAYAAIKKASKCLSVAYKMFGDNVSDEHLQKAAALMMDWPEDKLSEIFRKASKKDLEKIASKINVKVASFDKKAKKVEEVRRKKADHKVLAELSEMSDEELAEMMAEDWEEDEMPKKAAKKPKKEDLEMEDLMAEDWEEEEEEKKASGCGTKKKASRNTKEDDFFAEFDEEDNSIDLNPSEDPFELNISERPKLRKEASSKVKTLGGNISAKDINNIDVEDLSKLWGSAPDISKLI